MARHFRRQPNLRHLRIFHQGFHLRPRQDRLRREFGKKGRADHAGDMIAMLMRHDDEFCRAQRLLTLRVGFREIGFLLAAAEEFVHLQVHAGIDHHGAVGIDDLKGRARLDAGDFGRALDGKILGTSAFGEFQHIDAEWPCARNEGCGLAHRGDVGGPGGSLSARRRDCEQKGQSGNGETKDARNHFAISESVAAGQ